MNWKNDLYRYFSGVIFLLFILLGISVFIAVSIAVMVWVMLLYSLVYLPLLFAYRFSPKSNIKREKEVGIIVMNDISHFREIVDKAVKENPVAQRDVELRLLNVLAVDLSIKYDLPEMTIRRNLGNEKFMRELMGDSGKIVKEIYDRRHELRKARKREEFLRDIGILMEAMG